MVICIRQENYELQSDENRGEVAKEIVDKFLNKSSNQFVDIVNEELIESASKTGLNINKELFAECSKYDH